MHATTPTRGEPLGEAGEAIDELLAVVLDDANQFVRQLRLPAAQQHLYDDIVQDTMIIAHSKVGALAVLEPGARRGWTHSTVFLVTRNTRRAEFRRTATWERLRDAFEHESVRSHFDEPGDDRSDQLMRALAVLSELDRQLLVGQVWAGLTATELAARHDLTPKAVRHRITRARTTARESFSESFAKDGAIGGSSGHS